MGISDTNGIADRRGGRASTGLASCFDGVGSVFAMADLAAAIAA
jgi:hypothetical protein